MKKIILAILTMALLITGVCLLNADPKFDHKVTVHNVCVDQEDVELTVYEKYVPNPQPYGYYTEEPLHTTVVFHHVYTPETSAWYVVVEQGNRSVTADLPAWGDITVTLPGNCPNSPIPPPEPQEE